MQMVEDPNLEILPTEYVCPLTDCRLIHLRAAGSSACDQA